MRTYLEPEDVSRMEEAATCLRDKLLIRLLFRLACRISEALALKVEDIDLANNQVTIIHLKSRIRLLCPNCNTRIGRVHPYCPKCGNRVQEAIEKEMEHRRLRILPVDTDTTRMLEEYVRLGGPVSRKGVRLLFGVNRHRGWQIVRECADRAGVAPLFNPETGKVRGISPHRLRDAFAVYAVRTDDSGDGLRLLQEYLGHVSFDTTARYRKVAGKELRQWHQNLWQT